MSIDKRVAEIAELIGGTVIGDGNTRITGLNGIRQAAPGDLTFLNDQRYANHMQGTLASAVLVRPDISQSPKVLIQVQEPYTAFSKLWEAFISIQAPEPDGIHPTAVVAHTAKLGQHVAIGPRAVVSDDCRIADGAVIAAGAFIGHRCVIGEKTRIHPNATVHDGTIIGARCIIQSGAILGGDGFGFQRGTSGSNEKIPQLGHVHIGDDVEIGANTCIDRATFGATRIGNGTKIDNLVQIGHNTEIGEHCIICGNAGIAGSTVIGHGVVIAAGAGISGHIEIGDGARIGAFTGVSRSVPPGQDMFGIPAMEIKQATRAYGALRHLADHLRRLRKIEGKLHDMESANGKAEDHS